MKLTEEQLWDLVRCSAWLESGDGKEADSETKKQDAAFRRLHKKLFKFYEQNRKSTYELK